MLIMFIFPRLIRAADAGLRRDRSFPAAGFPLRCGEQLDHLSVMTSSATPLSKALGPVVLSPGPPIESARAAASGGGFVVELEAFSGPLGAAPAA
jgi:hypothetical protein